MSTQGITIIIGTGLILLAIVGFIKTPWLEIPKQKMHARFAFGILGCIALAITALISIPHPQSGIPAPQSSSPSATPTNLTASGAPTNTSSTSISATRRVACLNLAHAITRESAAILAVDKDVDRTADTPTKIEPGYSGAEALESMANGATQDALTNYQAVGLTPPNSPDIGTILNEVSGIISRFPKEVQGHQIQIAKSDWSAMQDRPLSLSKKALPIITHECSTL